MVAEAFRVAGSMTTRGVLTLQVVGDLDAATEDRLTDELADWLGIDELVIDLHECTFMDSRGMSALLQCQRSIGTQASMRLIGVPSDVERIVRLAGLQRVLGLDPAI